MYVSPNSDLSFHPFSKYSAMQIVLFNFNYKEYVRNTIQKKIGHNIYEKNYDSTL